MLLSYKMDHLSSFASSMQGNRQANDKKKDGENSVSKTKAIGLFTFTCSIQPGIFVTPLTSLTKIMKNIVIALNTSIDKRRRGSCLPCVAVINSSF